MIKVFLFCIFTCLIQVCFAQKISTNEYENLITSNDFHLKGKVEKVISTATDYQGNSTTLPLYENEFYDQVSLEFNKNGQLTKRTNYLDYRGKLAIYNYVDYVYKSSNLLESQINTIINNGEDPKRIASDKTFFYDSKNRIVRLHEKVQGKSSMSNYETNFIYGNQLDKIITKVENTILSENNLIYNKKGKLVLDEVTSFDGKKGRKSYYIYDNDSPIFKEETGGNSSLITFFDKNIPSKIQFFDANKNLSYEATYNSLNEINSFKKQSFRNGQAVLTNYTISYEYDTKNNWIKATISSNGETKYYIKRTISYF